MMMLTLGRRSEERRERQKMEKGESDIMSGRESSLSPLKNINLIQKLKYFFHLLLVLFFRSIISFFLSFGLLLRSCFSISFCEIFPPTLPHFACVYNRVHWYFEEYRLSVEERERKRKKWGREEKEFFLYYDWMLRDFFFEAINQTSTFCRWYFPFSISFSHFFTPSLPFFLSLFFFFFSFFFTILLRFVQLFPRTKVWSRIDWSTRNREKEKKKNE